MSRENIEILYWNAENIFHPESGGPRGDQTFSSGWTLDKYNRKLDRVVELIGKSSKVNDFPPIIGISEVENSKTSKDLLKRFPEQFKLVEANSFDKYLDNILIYNSEIFSLLYSKYHSVIKRSDKGDFLECDLLHKKSDKIVTIYVCHFKSKYEGDEYTEAFRCVNCDHLQQHLLEKHGKESSPFIVVGDFNDDPFSKPMFQYLLSTYDFEFVKNQIVDDKIFLYNASFEKLLDKNPGTLYHRNKFGTPWMIFDQFIISPFMLNESSEVKYCEKSYSVVDNLSSTKDGEPDRCLRWNENGRYFSEGYSDHFPIKIEIEFKY